MMKRMVPWVVGVSLLSAAGCGQDRYRKYELGPARPVVGRCVDMMGGLDRWRSVKPIRATALVTLYDSAGQASINEQQHVIDLGAGKIHATAKVPEGRWSATVGDGGRHDFDADGFVASQEMISQVVASLGTILHRVRGPLNLCGQGERALTAEPVRLAGEELTRVGVTGGNGGVLLQRRNVPAAIRHGGG